MTFIFAGLIFTSCQNEEKTIIRNIETSQASGGGVIDGGGGGFDLATEKDIRLELRLAIENLTSDNESENFADILREEVFLSRKLKVDFHSFQRADTGFGEDEYGEVGYVEYPSHQNSETDNTYRVGDTIFDESDYQGASREMEQILQKIVGNPKSFIISNYRHCLFHEGGNNSPMNGSSSELEYNEDCEKRYSLEVDGLKKWISRDTFEISEKCDDLYGNDKLATVTSFSRDAKICISIEEFSNIQKSDLKKNMYAIIFHEVAHMAGLYELSASKFEKFIRNWFPKIITKINENKIKREKDINRVIGLFEETLEVWNESPGEIKHPEMIFGNICTENFEGVFSHVEFRMCDELVKEIDNILYYELDEGEEIPDDVKNQYVSERVKMFISHLKNIDYSKPVNIRDNARDYDILLQI